MFGKFKRFLPGLAPVQLPAVTYTRPEIQYWQGHKVGRPDAVGIGHVIYEAPTLSYSYDWITAQPVDAGLGDCPDCLAATQIFLGNDLSGTYSGV